MGALSGLPAINNELIVNEYELSRNLIKRNSNSPIKCDNNNFYEIKLDRKTIDFEFSIGYLKIKDGYIQGLIDNFYLCESVHDDVDKNVLKAAIA